MSRKTKKTSRNNITDRSVFPSVQEIEHRVDTGYPVDRRFIIQLIRQSSGKFKKTLSRTNVAQYTRDQISERIASDVHAQLKRLTSFRLNRVINATGIILHTGLGRAPLSSEAAEHLNDVLRHYCSLEFDLETGDRGDRNDIVEQLICLLTGAESACVVNNNAAAVMIALNSLADQKEVVVSRGQLIEIGGSFRLPDVMEKSGVRIRETGTTNKTHLSDYRRSIHKQTGAVLVAHTSNYRILGFTHEPALSDLSRLCREKRIPLIYDLGGGVLIALERYHLPHEPVVAEAAEQGADVITFSGDKLLGACQCGILAGKKKYIDLVRRNPLMRALRCGKMTYAVLEATLKSFLHETALNKNHPALSMLTAPPEEIRRRAERLTCMLTELAGIQAIITESAAQAGSGTLPLESIPSFAVDVRVKGLTPAVLAKQLRLAKVPVIGYINSHKYFLDMRTVRDDELSPIVDEFKTIIHSLRRTS